MGRPKGSRNKKRKYTRRKRRVFDPADVGADLAALNGDIEGKHLADKIEKQLLAAEPLVAKAAVLDLIDRLQLVAKIVNGLPSAP